MNMKFLRVLCIAVLCLVFTACSPKPEFKNIDITGSTAFGKEFSLLDPDGKVRTLADFKGVINLLCPQADKVQVLFVTVDPARDTTEVLKQYVPAFDPRFLGLRPADEASLEKVTKDFKIYYKKVPGSSPDSYTIDHTAGSYAFDPNGHLRLYIKHAQGPETLAHDLKELLK